jgi:hypothetical protein
MLDYKCKYDKEYYNKECENCKDKENCILYEIIYQDDFPF